ncbi:sugar ABC transporter substrate-binding protein [Streptomyces sp. NPDC047009]|uniref:ABC transporter substrate-binding protein n=1 Tax=Streptomyces sp. NPDC047009 TaxID=3154496 RepID=UPI0033F67E2C
MHTPRIAALAASVAALALTTACAQGSATRSSSADGVSTVRYMTFSAGADHAKDLDAIVAAFEKNNPTIKVQVQSVPYANYATTLQTAISGGTAPDTFELDQQSLATYASSGALLDLAQPAAKDPSYHSSAYAPANLKAAQYKGKQYALPESFSTVVLIYNKTLFAKAGVATPTAGWTWKDEQAAARKLTDAGKGVWGDFQPITFNEFSKALDQAGGSFLSADGTKATFDSPQGIAAAKWLISKNKTTMPDVAKSANTPDYDTNLFKAGKLAMWHNGNWQFSTLQNVPFDWDVAVEPGDTHKASAVFQNSAGISKTTQHADAAFKWLAYLTASDTTAKTRVDSSWELPPLADTSKVAGYLNAGKPANRQAVFDSLKQQATAPVIAKQQQMQDIVNNALTDAAAGRTDVARALSQAARQVTALLN